MKNFRLAHVCTAMVGSALLAIPLAPAAGQPILNRVEQMLRDQIDSAVKGAGKTAEPGYLGMLGDDSTPSGRGISVLEVYPGQAAADAGLQPGDLITRIGGREVRSMDDMGAVLAERGPGAKLTFTVQRAGAARDMSVTLGRRPPDGGSAVNELPSPDPIPTSPVPPTPSSSQAPSSTSTTAGTPAGAPTRPKLGVRTVPVTADVQRQHQLATASGAQVVSVAVDSPAAKANIPLGAVITAFDDMPVRSPEDLAAGVRATDKREVPLTYVNAGRTQKVTIDLGTMVLSPSAPAPGPQLETRARPPQPVQQSTTQTPPPPTPEPPAPEFPIPAAAPAATVPEASETPAEKERRLVSELGEGGMSPSTEARLEALERLVAELEARIKSLEARLAQDEASK
jgi:membrane-associated protease RseP (regulator of RpoE activity)